MTFLVKCRNSRYVVSVSDEDWPKIKSFHWMAHKEKGSAYIYRRVGHGPRTFITWDLFGHPPHGYVWDHIDHDTLNNTRSNIRLATYAENRRNGRKLKTTQRKRQDSLYKQSIYKGVTYNLTHGRDSLLKPWRANLYFTGRCINLGYFATAEAAANEYNKAALEHFGEFAHLNSI